MHGKRSDYCKVPIDALLSVAAPFRDRRCQGFSGVTKTLAAAFLKHAFLKRQGEGKQHTLGNVLW